MKNVGLYCAICLLCVGIFSNGALCQISITVTPPIIETEVTPGGLRSWKLVVSNKSRSNLDIRGYTRDLGLQPDGSPIVLEQGSRDRSCAQWIELSHNQFTLAPDEKKEIMATMRIPRGTRGGYYSIIMFESVSAEQKKQGGILLGARLGTVVLVSIAWTLDNNAEIVKMTVDKAQADERNTAKIPEDIKPVLFNVTLENKGNVHIKAQGSIVIKDAKKEIIDRIPLEVGTGTVLPGEIRIFKATWQNPWKMKKGQFIAEAQIDYRGRTQAKSEKLFTVY